ncbi:MAG: hypothetical protein MK209_00660 [Planctomycetes bacterium]|nr:hypothetical protein [Planctomycetota bacterium]
MRVRHVSYLIIPCLLASCASVLSEDRPSFLAEASWLEEEAGGRLILSGTGGFVYSPLLQGRVMTSTVDLSEPGLGFVNREAIALRGEPAAFHNHGGVERFWIGPEGSQFSLYFDPGAPFVAELWRVPKDLDVGPFDEVALGQMERDMVIRNRIGTEFTMRVGRHVEVPTQDEVESVVGAVPPGSLWSAFRTINTVTNTGESAWSREGGLPCIWLAGMFLPGERSWSILPFRTDREDPDGGPAVRSEYFGEPGAVIDEKRLRFGRNFAILRTDSELRCKVGVRRNRARNVIAAFDPSTEVLTIVHFSPIDENAGYVDETWATGGDPYYGDVVNSYNHSGPESFFELESSSPALALAPGEGHTHRSTTMQFRFADEEHLSAAVRTALGLDWAEVKVLADWD